MDANQPVAAPVKKRSGCQTGCLIVSVIIIVCVVATVYIVNRLMHQVIDTVTTATPVAVTVVAVDPATAQAATSKYQLIRDAFQNNKAAEVRFTAAEINNLIAAHPDLEILKGKLFVELSGDNAAVSYNLPLGILAAVAPGLKMIGLDVTDRYINGHGIGTFSMKGDEARVTLSQLDFNGTKAPAEVIRELNSGLAKKRVIDTKNPKADQLLKQVDTIAVENSELLIKSKPE